MSNIGRALVLSIVLFEYASSQVNYNDYNSFYNPKPGSCPPALPLQFCSRRCDVDAQCEGNAKCCPTTCGGTICSRPVTMGRPMTKPGYCPVEETGKWICTSTCSHDSDCRGPKKCCPNRCGARVCLKATEETVPIAVQPEPVYEIPADNYNPYFNYDRSS